MLNAVIYKSVLAISIYFLRQRCDSFDFRSNKSGIDRVKKLTERIKPLELHLCGSGLFLLLTPQQEQLRLLLRRQVLLSFLPL